MDFDYNVFISYSSKDREWVRGELLNQLEARGLKACLDFRDFRPGAASVKEIERALQTSRKTLIILTPAYLESAWTEFETLVLQTLDPANRDLRLIPLLKEKCDLPLRLRYLTYVDFAAPEDLDIAWTQLLTALGAPPSASTSDFAVDQVNQKVSAFIVGPPIHYPRQFFGRERELKRLFNLWKYAPLQNAAIIGPKRSGKTSLLYYLKNITTIEPSHLRLGQRSDWLLQPERYRWVFVDFQDSQLGTREGFLRYLLNSLHLPQIHKCDLDHFMNVVSNSLHLPTVILLDEIGVALQRYPELDDSFWEGLRSLANNHVNGNLAFVLAAYESPDQLAHHSSIGSPFFNIFGYIANLGPLTESEAHELISNSPRQFSPSDVEWILTQSGRWPLLLQILCRERLIALEDDETDNSWREGALFQMEPFRHLLVS